MIVCCISFVDSRGFGIDADTVEQAYCKAVKMAGMSRGYQRACGVIYKVIPLSRIGKRLCDIQTA